ncbi:MAG TPA: hypothetical protein VNU97_09705 [Rhizomicrobium sp.]|jgi:hypothetical protein|nr:hypothetical protein [Rhizomicrobium sp.]
MTNINSYVPAQHSAFNSAVSNIFAAALVIMAGVLTFAAFTAV